MQVAIPVMKRQGSGTIINISSVAGHIALPQQAAYSATKFAMNAIGHAAGVELSESGVKVMTVCPGYINTNFRSNTVVGRDRKRVASGDSGGAPEQVARATVRGYLRGKREVIVPEKNRLFIRIYQWIPSLVDGAMKRMIRPYEPGGARAEH